MGGSLTASMATTGFVTMALSILWLFSFQNLYGYVYQRIGWIVALFMAGLVVGSLTSVAWARRKIRPPKATARDGLLCSRLIAVDLLLALLSLAAPPVLTLMASLQGSRLDLLVVEGGVSLLVAVTGLLCGAAFAFGGGLQLRLRGEAATAAGSVVGADHAGACFGALATGILLVPVYGVVATAFLLAGLKLSSAVLLLLANQFSREV
jgi:spermidine synthase